MNSLNSVELILFDRLSSLWRQPQLIHSLRLLASRETQQTLLFQQRLQLQPQLQRQQLPQRQQVDFH